MKSLVAKGLVFFLILTGGVMELNADVEVGQVVWAYHEASKAYYLGTAVEADNTIKGGGFKIVFFDTDVFVVPYARIRPFSLSVGMPVFARWTDGQFYPGKVGRILGQAVFVFFDDGDETWTSYAGLALKD